MISENRLGSFWRNLLDNLPQERRIGKDDDLQELLDDTSRLYNYFSSDSTPKIDFAEEIEPVQIRDGHLYVLAIAGQLKIKRLASVKGGIEVRSDNPTYGTETYKGDELSQIKIFGKVLEISRAV